MTPQGDIKSHWYKFSFLLIIQTAASRQSLYLSLFSSFFAFGDVETREKSISVRPRKESSRHGRPKRANISCWWTKSNRARFSNQFPKRCDPARSRSHSRQPQVRVLLVSSFFKIEVTETMRGVNRQPKKVIRVSQIDLIESDSDDEDVSFRSIRLAFNSLLNTHTT